MFQSLVLSELQKVFFSFPQPFFPFRLHLCLCFMFPKSLFSFPLFVFMFPSV